MPTPSIPSGFKPIVQGYSIGSPDGVRASEVGGGLPRTALEWDRGRQAFQVTLILQPEQFAVWSAWYHRIIMNGAVQFTMPLDSGFGLADHLCVMVPGSYSAMRAGGQIWSASFTVLAENGAFGLSASEAALLVDLWNLYGMETDELLARIAQFANVDSLVLAL